MDIDKLAKPYFKDVTPYKPGKPIEQARRESGREGPIIKLASNENPYPPSDTIKRAVIEAMEETNRYPESGVPELTKQIANLHGVESDEVFVGHGTNEILDLMIRAYVNPDENCVFSQLSFIIYKLICTQCGVIPIEVPCRDYTHDLKAMAGAVTDKTKIVFICNPNNPTATYNNTSDIEAFLAEAPDHLLVVFDEAYHEFVDAGDYPDSLALRRKYDKLVILRTFSKFYSLAGIRIGYAIADRRVVGILNKIRQPFNVNRLAQAAASAAIACREDLAWFIDETIRERARMRQAIIKLGCDCPPTQTNFLFVVASGYTGDICRKLEDDGVIVRPMSHFGAPANAFRVNTGTPQENDRFLEAFARVISS